MLQDLPQFLALLRAERDLAEIDAPVDPHLEAAEIHRRVIAAGGPALLFKRIKGAAFPLVTNLFGTTRRLELALGTRPERIVRALSRLPETLLPPSLGKLWQQRGCVGQLLKIGLSRRASGPVCEVHERTPGLTRLPLLTTWREDGGAFITLPLVYSEHPETHIHNLGMYRLQRFDDAATGFHCQIGKGAGFHLAAAQALGRKLPVNVHVGGPPVLTIAAVAPLPENVPELLLASLMLGRRLRMARNPFGPLPVIADCEFVLVGEVDPRETRPEGPFGDHYGYYSLAHDYPVFRCTGVLRRKNAICTATVVGKPRQEDFVIGDYLQELLKPLVGLIMPSVRDLWSYGETGYHSLAAAVVRERYAREALAAAFRILGEGQLSLTKFLLVTDEPRDLRDFAAVLEHVLARCDFRSDLYVFSNLAMDTLDYTGPRVNEGSKGVLLGVGAPMRELPAEFSGTLPQGISAAQPFCRGCLVLQGRPARSEPLLAERIAVHRDFAAWPLLVIVDDARAAARNTTSFLWTTFTRFEPGADIYSAGRSIERNHVSRRAPIVIDARMKPSYPGELSCDEQTSATVSRRWAEYFCRSPER